MDYTMVPARVVLSLTGLSAAKIKRLTPLFSTCWETIRKKNGLGKSEKRPGRPRKIHLRHILIFVLSYLKTNLTFDGLSALFLVKRSTFHCLVKKGLDAIELAMNNSGNLPARDYASALSFLLALKGKKAVFIDATERPIRRPKRNQKNFYSGKKKCHTVKNQIISIKSKKILCVSQTEQGRIHDFKIFRDQKIADNLPKTIKIHLYYGYQGVKKSHPKHKIFIPVKKRRNRELTASEKKSNKTLSSKRITVEHAIGGIKRMRAVSEVCRSINFKLRDQKFIVCAGLWNYFIAA